MLAFDTRLLFLVAVTAASCLGQPTLTLTPSDGTRSGRTRARKARLIAAADLETSSLAVPADILLWPAAAVMHQLVQELPDLQQIVTQEGDNPCDWTGVPSGENTPWKVWLAAIFFLL